MSSMTTSGCRLFAHDLSHTFPNGLKALAGLQLEVKAGELVAIVGPSGCGKSTLLRLFAGLDAATSGVIGVENVASEAASDAASEAASEGRASVGFVFQQPTLLPWRSVVQNVVLPLELKSRPVPSAAAVSLLLERVGLSGFERVYPHQLSGGMQMRVSVARALLTRPSLMLMDEPFAALDELTRQALQEELLRLWQEDGFTTLFVTHNVFEAVFLAQRVLVMSARPGQILADVPVLLPYPRTPALRGQPDFARLVGEVSDWLRKSHR